MERFFMNAITEQLINSEVKNFLEKEFPRIQQPNQWRFEYLQMIEKSMIDERFYSTANHLEAARKKFVESFETSLGKAVAAVLADWKGKYFPLSHLMFTEKCLCDIMVKAKDVTYEKVTTNYCDKAIGFHNVFFSELYEGIEELLKKCEEFHDKLANAVDKVTQEENKEDKASMIPESENDQASENNDEKQHECCGCGKCKNSSKTAEPKPEDASDTPPEETEAKKVRVQAVKTGTNHKVPEKENTHAPDATDVENDKAQEKEKTPTSDDSDKSEKRISVGMCLHPIFGLCIMVEDEEDFRFFI